MRYRVLIAESEQVSRNLLTAAFPGGDFLTHAVASGEKLLESVFDWNPDVILLDIRLPGISGEQVLGILKMDKRVSNIPVVVLGESVKEETVIEILRSGADQFISKPFNTIELLWRIRAVIRRKNINTESGESALLEMGVVKIDLDRYRVYVSGKSVDLPRMEMNLLETLIRNKERVLKRQFLLERIWGFDSSITTRTVDLHVSRLRQKLGKSAGKYLQTVHGMGYYFGLTPR